MDGLNSKRRFIDSLTIAHNMMLKLNKKDEESIDYITYLTTTGYVIGKQVDLVELNSESGESLLEAIQQAVGEGKDVDLFSVAAAIHRYMRDQGAEEGNPFYDTDKALMLEDVTIKYHGGGSSINTHVFALFIDQVLGVLPGKVELY